MLRRPTEGQWSLVNGATVTLESIGSSTIGRYEARVAMALLLEAPSARFVEIKTRRLGGSHIKPRVKSE